MWVAIDWCRSEKQQLSVSAGELGVFRCGEANSALDAAARSVFRPSQYLSLERV